MNVQHDCEYSKISFHIFQKIQCFEYEYIVSLDEVSKRSQYLNNILILQKYCDFSNR